MLLDCKMKKILFNLNQQEVQIINCEHVNDIFDSVSSDIKYCVLADKKILEIHNSLREKIKNNNFVVKKFNEID